LVWRFLFPKDILNLVYIAKSYGLNEVRLLGTNDYMNDIKRRFSNNIVQTLYNTVSDKKLPFWDGLSKDTNDTRSAAIYVADDLINENAKLLFMILKCRERKC
jgi:UDPglucose 6-dehydrogenase